MVKSGSVWRHGSILQLSVSTQPRWRADILIGGCLKANGTSYLAMFHVLPDALSPQGHLRSVSRRMLTNAWVRDGCDYSSQDHSNADPDNLTLP